MTLTFDEALALCLGRRFLEPLAGTLFWEAAQSCMRKIQAGLGDGVLKYLEKMAPRFHATTTGVSDYTAKSEILDTLMIAIEDHRAVFITYQSARATEPVTYDIYPYGVTYHRGSLYAIGYAPRREEVRRWKLDRIEQASLAEVKFQRPEDFDLRKHLESSFGVYHGHKHVLVRVRFSREVARYVREKQWSAKQKLTPKSDGGLLAEFQLSSTVEIKSWILSFGRHAEALEPDSLRQDIAEELALLAARYRVDGANEANAETRSPKHKLKP